MQQLNCVCDTLAKRVVTTAILKGYHNRQTQMLPCNNIALVVWGSKVTGDIPGPLRFYARKAVARTNLQQRKKNKWMREQADMYKI
jgi:hypothetical protein